MTVIHKARTFFNPLVSFALAAALIGGAAPSLAVDAKASKYYENALVRYEKKDLDGAIIQLKNALQIDPTMLPVQLLLGRALLQTGDVVAAEVALTEALRLGVNRAEVVVLLGRAYTAQGKHKLLLEQQQFSPIGLPKHAQVQVHLLRAAAYGDLGDMRAAMKAIEDARALDPTAAEVWSAEVPLRIRARQFREATAAIDKAMALAPNQAGIWNQKGSIMHVQGDMTGALAAYDQALKLDDGLIDARVARAGLLLDLKRVEEAAKEVSTIQEQAPDDPRAAYLRALVSERKGDAAAMAAAMKDVVELIDPVPMDFLKFRPQLLMLNGLAHFGLNEREKAKQYLEAFQKALGTSAATKVLAQIYASESKTDRAIDLLEGYLKSQPGDGQAMTMLGAIYMDKGQYAKATALMQEALRTRDAPEYRTVLGISLIRSGQSATGVTELETVFKKSPTQVQAGTTLIDIYLRSGQAVKAIAATEALIKQYPNNAMFHNLLGMARGLAGNGAAAKAAFEQALKLDPSLVGAKLNMARLEVATKAYDAATARLDAVLKDNPKNAEAMFEMSIIAEQRGKTVDAQRWLEKTNDLSGPKELRWGLALLDFFLRNRQADLALQMAKKLLGKAPENLQVLMGYSRAQLALGDTIGARSTLSGATRFGEYNAPLQLEIALMQIRANNPDGAAYSLDKALAGQPDFLPAMALMADVELRKNDPVKAEKRARDILAKNPKRAIGYSLLGDVARYRGQLPVAIDNYRRAHQTEPSTETLMRLFGALSSQDGGKSAIPLAEQWVKAHPQDTVARKALGDAYARSGNYSQARSSYESLLKLTPDDSTVLNDLANALFRMKDPAALKTAEQAVAKNPSNPNAIDTLGWLLFQNGQADKALTLLRDARLREPDNPEIRYHLAVVLTKSGRKGEAILELEAALKPGNPFESSADAQALLRTLK